MHPGQAIFYAILVAVSGAMTAVATALQAGTIPLPPEFVWAVPLLVAALMGAAHQLVTKRVPDPAPPAAAA